MDPSKVPPVTNPGIDVGESLAYLMGDTGGVQESLGGFKIKVYHTKAFPWGEVFKWLANETNKQVIATYKPSGTFTLFHTLGPFVYVAALTS